MEIKFISDVFDLALLSREDLPFWGAPIWLFLDAVFPLICLTMKNSVEILHCTINRYNFYMLIKKLKNVKGEGNVNYRDLIITHCTHGSTYHPVSHKFVIYIFKHTKQSFAFCLTLQLSFQWKF